MCSVILPRSVLPATSSSQLKDTPLTHAQAVSKPPAFTNVTTCTLFWTRFLLPFHSYGKGGFVPLSQGTAGANTAQDSVIFTRPRSWKRDKWASNIVKEQTVLALASARRLWVAEEIRSTLEVTQVWSSTPTAAALKVQGQTSIWSIARVWKQWTAWSRKMETRP